jgi:diadenosine tetraphosphate (Ap4A) HIT family hydrolase
VCEFPWCLSKKKQKNKKNKEKRGSLFRPAGRFAAAGRFTRGGAIPLVLGAGTVAMVLVLLAARLSTSVPSEVTQFAEAGLFFGRTTIKPSKVTFTSRHSAAFSARPISKSHTVVTTRRRVTRSAELSSEEYLDLWRTVAAARDAAMSARGAAATNLLLKDGVGCGAAVPHVHVHIVPRVPGDFFPNDKVFSAIERWAPSLKDELARPDVAVMDIPDDADRKDRTFEMMSTEAGTYRVIVGGNMPDRDHTFGRFTIDKQHIFAQSKGERPRRLPWPWHARPLAYCFLRLLPARPNRIPFARCVQVGRRWPLSIFVHLCQGTFLSRPVGSSRARESCHGLHGRC